MVYLNNDNNKQDVYIPRNDGQGAYVSPCDKCYQAGYKDGCEECGNVNLEDKSVVVTAATQTVFPSSGYDGMTSVDVDATEWGQSKYDEGHDDGYDEGYGNGEDDQKARLSSATFVENGHYELENGWSAVTVQTTCPSPSLEDKNFYLESGFTPTTITPSSGYDGLSSVRVEDHGYGQERYDNGFSDGERTQRDRLVSTAITANGIYSRADGYSQIDVQVPVEVPCNIENGVSINLINYPGYETTVVPSSGYAGLASVHADGSGIYTQGVLDVANQFVPLTATTNGVYLPQSKYAVFSSVTVSVVIPSIESGKTLSINSGETSPWTVLPSSGYDAMDSVVVTDNGYGQEKYDEGYDAAYLAMNAIGIYKTNDGLIYDGKFRKYIDPEDHTAGYTNCPYKTSYIGDYGYYFFNIEDGTPIRIGQGGFRDYDTPSRLTFIKLPDCVDWIGDFAFQNCTNLKELIMPSGFTDFSFSSVDGCSSLTKIVCLATTAPTISGALAGSTLNIAQSGVMYVPAGSNYSTWGAILPSGWTISATL